MITSFFKFTNVMGYLFLFTVFTARFKAVLIKKCTLLQHGIDDDQKFACERNYGFFSPFLLLDSPVPCGKIGITLSSNGPGNLTKRPSSYHPPALVPERSAVITAAFAAAASESARIHTNQKKMEIFFSLQTV